MKAYSLYLTAIQKDLRQLVEAQESFFADNVSYADSTDALPFEASPGVQVTLTDVGKVGWTATATHSQLPQIRCSITVGA